MTLGEAILEYRARNNLSMRQFAEKCGISLQTVNYVEKGLQKPSRLTKEKIMLVLKGEK